MSAPPAQHPAARGASIFASPLLSTHASGGLPNPPSGPALDPSPGLAILMRRPRSPVHASLSAVYARSEASSCKSRSITSIRTYRIAFPLPRRKNPIDDGIGGPQARCEPAHKYKFVGLEGYQTCFPAHLPARSQQARRHPAERSIRAEQHRSLCICPGTTMETIDPIVNSVLLIVGVDDSPLHASLDFRRWISRPTVLFCRIGCMR